MFEWLRGLTGDWGLPLFNWYLTNSNWINILVVVYGVVLVISWHTYEKVQQRLADLLLADIEANPSGGGSEPPWVSEEVPLLFEKALAGIYFPWIAQRSHIVPRRCTQANLRNMIDMDALRKKAEEQMARRGQALQEKYR